jgi:hypothetical protein
LTEEEENYIFRKKSRDGYRERERKREKDTDSRSEAQSQAQRDRRCNKSPPE